jgi:hypothetical protein
MTNKTKKVWKKVGTIVNKQGKVIGYAKQLQRKQS